MNRKGKKDKFLMLAAGIVLSVLLTGCAGNEGAGDRGRGNTFQADNAENTVQTTNAPAGVDSSYTENKALTEGSAWEADSETTLAMTQAPTTTPIPTQTPTPTSTPTPTPTPVPTPTPIPSDYMVTLSQTVLEEESKMDIDFAALAETDAATYKKIDEYVASLTPSKKNGLTGIFEGKNLIFISAEAFTAEVIDENLTPTLYRLATKGIQFTDYYQPAGAGTTGGECQNIFGFFPVLGGSSVKKTADENNYFTMGNQLNRLGYFGKAYHNGSYTFYDRDKTHNNLGYSEGFMAYGNGMEQYIKPTWPESDYDMFVGTIPEYIDQEHFNVYYMSVSGHSNYGFNCNAMAKKHKDRVADMEASTPIKAYYAANLDFEDALCYLVGQLEEKGIADDTVIVISADHYPYGLDGGSSAGYGQMKYLSELYGEKVENVFQRDHNRLILWCGCLEEYDPIVVSDPVCSIDILPTLSNLFGTDWDSRLLPGRDVFSDAMPIAILDRSNWKTDLGICKKGKFSPYDENAEIPEGYVKTVNAYVSKKYDYCKNVLTTDYYGHLFDLGVLQ